MRILLHPRSRPDDGFMALEIPCPACGTQMYAEQAHNRCPRCLYIEPCCDGAPLAYCQRPEENS